MQPEFLPHTFNTAEDDPPWLLKMETCHTNKRLKYPNGKQSLESTQRQSCIWKYSVDSSDRSNCVVTQGTACCGAGGKPVYASEPRSIFQESTKSTCLFLDQTVPLLLSGGSTEKVLNIFVTRCHEQRNNEMNRITFYAFDVSVIIKTTRVYIILLEAY